MFKRQTKSLEDLLGEYISLHHKNQSLHQELNLLSLSQHLLHGDILKILGARKAVSHLFPVKFHKRFSHKGYLITVTDQKIYIERIEEL